MLYKTVAGMPKALERCIKTHSGALMKEEGLNEARMNKCDNVDGMGGDLLDR